MSTAVKNQLRVCIWSVRYNIMKEMLNKVTFLSNICFMMLNNAAFLIQWAILFRLKENIGGYTMREVLFLWGIVAGSYGLSHTFFDRAFSISGLIINGKLDSYLVQPKNVLAGVITSGTSTSAIGDFLYGFAVICVFDFHIGRLLLFLFFSVTGAVILTSFALLMGSLSFWLVRIEQLGNNMIGIMTSFTTYPEGIFHGMARFLLYLVIPVGMVSYLPVQVMAEFTFWKAAAVACYAAGLAGAAIVVFYRGLRRYSSGSLMEARL